MGLQPAAETDPGRPLRVIYSLPVSADDIRAIAWHPTGDTLAAVSAREGLLIWPDVAEPAAQTARAEATSCVTFSGDGKSVASCVGDNVIEVVTLGDGTLEATLTLDQAVVNALAWSPVRRLLAIAFKPADVDAAAPDAAEAVPSHRHGLRIWDLTGADPVGAQYTEFVFPGEALCVAWSPTGELVAAGGRAQTLRVWNVSTGALQRVLENSCDPSLHLAWSPDGALVAAGGQDGVIRIWDTKKGTLIRLLDGHADAVTAVSFSPDGRFVASRSLDDTLRLWECAVWEEIATEMDAALPGERFPCLCFHPSRNWLASVDAAAGRITIRELNLEVCAAVPRPARYINAKIVLVGEGGVGKSTLAIRLAESRFLQTQATHAARSWVVSVPDEYLITDDIGPIRAEVSIWDLAGQADYRVVHQLFLNDADVALLLFDSSSHEDPFRGVPYWVKVLNQHLPATTAKFLVAARCDVCLPTLSQRSIPKMLSTYGMDKFFTTSALKNEGIDEIKRAAFASIPWAELARTTPPRIFHFVRQLLEQRRNQGLRLVGVDQLREEISAKYVGRAVGEQEIDATIKALQRRGIVYCLKCSTGSDQIVLQPELISQYASSIVQEARRDAQHVGAVPERALFDGSIRFADVDRLSLDDERTVLIAIIQVLIDRQLCFRQMGLLVFPSLVTLAKTFSEDEQTSPVVVTFRFSGAVETVYASLVISLIYMNYWTLEEQWRFAVEFSVQNGGRIGLSTRHITSGTAEFDIHFTDTVDKYDRIYFIRYVAAHLRKEKVEYEERIHLYCDNPNCGKEFTDVKAIEARKRHSNPTIPCPYCENRITIPERIEDLYGEREAHVGRIVDAQKDTDRVRQGEVEKVEPSLDWTKYPKPHGVARVLVLSDLHFGPSASPDTQFSQILTDLTTNLEVDRLDYLVICGDVANQATADEYERACEFVELLMARFGLAPDRVMTVPGNHDVNWSASEASYDFKFAKSSDPPAPDDRVIRAGNMIAVRNESKYGERFQTFSDAFYRKVHRNPYPLERREQAVLLHRPDDRLLFLGLNSCWELDHHFRERASIHQDALARVVSELSQDKYKGCIKIAVWHHPITGTAAMKDDFMELLADQGFEIGMHGHVHEAAEGLYKYDEKRRIHIIGNGTFGAAPGDQAPGIPLQYNLLKIDTHQRTVIIESRKKEKTGGAWRADARWGDKNEPEPRYRIHLKSASSSGRTFTPSRSEGPRD